MKELPGLIMIFIFGVAAFLGLYTIYQEVNRAANYQNEKLECPNCPD